jgi:hypothetical protein
VRGIGAGEPLLARRHAIENVAADVTGRESERAQAADHQMREVLADTAAMRKDFAHLGCYRSGLRIVDKIGVYAPRQIKHGGGQRAARGKTRARILGGFRE